MRRHDAAQPVFDETPERLQVRLFERLERTFVHRHFMMRIGCDVAVTRKMLADRRHAAVTQAAHHAARELGYRHRIAVKRAVPDHAAVAVIDVEHRGEAQIDPARAQFRGEHVADRLRQFERVFGIRIPRRAQFAHGGQHGKALAKALHAAAFVIDRDQQRRLAHGMNLARQFRELIGRAVVARKQDHAADQRMREAPAVVGGKLGARDVEHHRPERDLARRSS